MSSHIDGQPTEVRVQEDANGEPCVWRYTGDEDAAPTLLLAESQAPEAFAMIVRVFTLCDHLHDMVSNPDLHPMARPTIEAVAGDLRHAVDCPEKWHAE